ncbi:MAG: alpha/beta fold hydrolase, partial [Casimicrobiaceae bacterium]
MRPSQSQFLEVRGLRYHIRSWGDPAAPKLFMLHGWMDVSASFQFLVDALQKDWHVLAPDWRGYGLTEWPQDGYWFQDYVGDLDALADPPGLRPYANLSEAADRLQKTNPRLRRDRAEFLAQHWAELLPDGTARLRADPKHRL